MAYVNYNEACIEPLKCYQRKKYEMAKRFNKIAPWWVWNVYSIERKNYGVLHNNIYWYINN
jgi:hypothetical protein